MSAEWRGLVRSAALIASGALMTLCLISMMPKRMPADESQLKLELAEPYALPVLIPMTSSEKFKLSYSLAVRCNYTEVEALPLLLESISTQTVLPDETVVVLTQTVEDGLGETLMDLAYGSPDVKHVAGRTDRDVQQEKVGQLSAKEIGLRVKNATQPIELSVRLIPNLKVVMRAGHYTPSLDGLFAASQTRNDTALISVIDCNHYLHPRRTELIARTFADSEQVEILSHMYRKIRLSEWYRAGPQKSFLDGFTDLLPTQDLKGAEPKTNASEPLADQSVGWPSMRRSRLARDTESLTKDSAPYFLSEFDSTAKGWEYLPATLGLALDVHET